VVRNEKKDYEMFATHYQASQSQNILPSEVKRYALSAGIKKNAYKNLNNQF
jgi:hypothetical protein